MKNLKPVLLLGAVLWVLSVQLNAQDKASIMGEPISTEMNMEYAPTINQNGDWMIFEANPDGDWRLYQTWKYLGEWLEPTLITFGNTESYDFFGGPFLTYDEQYLFFTSDMEGGEGSLDIWYSEWLGEKWGPPVNLGAPVNTPEYEGFASVSPDGNTIYFMRDSDYPYYYDEEYEGEEYEEEYEEEEYESYEAEEHEEYADTGDYYEEWAEEESYDPEIYCYKIMVSHKNDDGTWSEPGELSFNSGCDENPRIMPDGKTLYYSSYNADNIGGFDIYKTVLQEDGTWSDPENAEFLNSKMDEGFVSITNGGTHIVFCRGMEDSGLPDDIYIIEIP